jgi:hypothetical protein
VGVVGIGLSTVTMSSNHLEAHITPLTMDGFAASLTIV